jgi:hypothetical protein
MLDNILLTPQKGEHHEVERSCSSNGLEVFNAGPQSSRAEYPTTVPTRPFTYNDA